MRNLCLLVYQEFGKECVKFLQVWKDWLRKITDFGNHRMFTLRCLKVGTTPASLKLKNTIRTPRCFDITRKVERQLLNERITCINNTIYICEIKRDTCINKLLSVLDRDTLQECWAFINRMREVLKRQKPKFKTLGQNQGWTLKNLQWTA